MILVFVKKNTWWEGTALMIWNRLLCFLWRRSMSMIKVWTNKEGSNQRITRQHHKKENVLARYCCLCAQVRMEYFVNKTYSSKDTKIFFTITCNYRTLWVLACNMVCIPTYLCWMALFLPIYLVNPATYWSIEEVMFSWMLSMVSCWSWSAGQCTLTNHNNQSHYTPIRIQSCWEWWRSG